MGRSARTFAVVMTSLFTRALAAHAQTPSLLDVAIRAAALPMGSGSRVEDTHWRRHQLFHFANATMPHIFPWVAVDPSTQRGVVISGDTRGDPQAAIDAFNTITRAERITIRTQAEADDYLRFFLRVHVTQGGSYIAGESVAATLRELTFSDPRREALMEQHGHHDDPVLLAMRRDGTMWRAHTYTWAWWAAYLVRRDLVMDEHGVIVSATSTPMGPTSR
jgi:hypothetical protein